MEWESSVPTWNDWRWFYHHHPKLLKPEPHPLTKNLKSAQQTPDTQQKEESWQTDSSMTNSVILENELYKILMRDAPRSFDLLNEVTKIRCGAQSWMATGILKWTPLNLKKDCEDAGARNIFTYIHQSIGAEKMSENRLPLFRIRTMVVSYILVFGLSQKSNWF